MNTRLIILVIAAGIMACSINPVKANSVLQIVVQGNTAFGFDVYQELKDEEGNLFYSPYSISTAFAMTYAGARGRTEKEMAEVLHFSSVQESLHSSFSRLQSELNAIQDKGYIKLSIANSLWVQEDYRFLDSFFAVNKKYYGAGLYFADFGNQPETARKTINAWVEEKTEEKIKNLIQNNVLTTFTRLILCNAVYFKGEWLHQFEKERTADADFYISPKKTINVPMMSQNSEFTFKDFGSFSAIDLPYEGNDLSMIILLPKKLDGLTELERDLTYENVNNWIDALSLSNETEVFVSLPKFKTNRENELSQVLSKMGMPSAFSAPPADFSGMTGDQDLFISKIIHKAVIDVNEEGTEAAAATAVLMESESLERPHIFRADHPFVFFIRENQTGSILFIGRIVDPSK